MKSLPLPNGFHALVDDEDYELYSCYKWCRQLKTDSVFRNRTRSDQTDMPVTIRLSREIMGVSKSSRPLVDHINGNPLDNRRSNLRLCTHAENNCNRKRRSDCSSGTSGVHKIPGRDVWQARIQVDGKRVSLGVYKTKEEAVAVRTDALAKYHGSFARYN
jgi:HNH endonuclease